jgi:hypothetical protein
VEAFEVGEDYSDTPRSTGDLGKFEYDNARATDGTDISSRTKLKRYLKATGTTLADDFKGEWQRAAEQREAKAAGTHNPDRRERREAVERAVYQLEKRGRK